MNIPLFQALPIAFTYVLLEHLEFRSSSLFQ